MMRELIILSPELILVLLAGGILCLSLFTSRAIAQRFMPLLAVSGLVVLLFLVGGRWIPSGTAIGGSYSTHALSQVFKTIFILADLLTVLLSWPRSDQPEDRSEEHLGEYLALLHLSMAGMCLLASARDLVLLYVSLELVTMPLILLVAFRRHELRSAEAALKYVFFSALASGLLLYGLSLVYGLTGSMNIQQCASRLTPGPLTTLALALCFAGVGFKMSAAPFHLWTPDTYEGAPIPVTAFISVASKAAGFVLFYQLIIGVFGADPRLLETLVATLAALTMTIGNLVALFQTNLKRFLAYSSIAQAGYLMIGLVNPELLGVTSVAFYLLVYVVSNIAAFTVVNLIARETGREEMQDYVGLSQTNPFLAAVMMLAMFSLAGIPPLAGFLGKFYLFAAAAEKGLYWLVLVGAINATISLFYYLLVIKWMYIVKPATPESLIDKVPLSLPGGVLLVSTSMAMVLIGLIPQFLHWIEESVLLARTGF